MTPAQVKGHKERISGAMSAIKVVNACDSITWNFNQATTITDVYETFRIFVAPILRDRGFDIVGLEDVNVDVFLSHIKTRVPLLRRHNLELKH